MCRSHVILLSRIMPRYLTESFFGIEILFMFSCGLFSQREGYTTGFIFIYFKAPFVEPRFHALCVTSTKILR